MLFPSLFILIVVLHVKAQASPAPIKVFDYLKFKDDYLVPRIKYEVGGPEVRVLAQMNSVETWLALKGCTGPICGPPEPTYTANPLYPCHLAAYYKCPVVGKGKPYVQSLVAAPLQNPIQLVNQLLLAVDFVNDLFPSSFLNGGKPLGVLGLGPICSKSCLVRQFDTDQYSASFLQNIFRLQYSTLLSLQQFYFQRTLYSEGSKIPSSQIFYQSQYQDNNDYLIPIVLGACTWTFKISSMIEVFNTTTVTGNPFRVVRQPASITYDPTYDFNIVSQEMAQAYADAFRSDGLNSYTACPERLGDLMVYRYYSGDNPSMELNFPALRFSAINEEQNNATLTFTGVQGVYIEDGDLTEDYKFYLPFAYRLTAPCCKDWILGYPALNNAQNVQAGGTLYNYPKLVAGGTAQQIEAYFIQLKA